MRFNFFYMFSTKVDVFRRDQTHLFTYAAYLYTQFSVQQLTVLQDLYFTNENNYI